LVATVSCTQPRSATDLEVVVKNGTGREVTGLVVSDGGSKVTLPPIASGKSASARFNVPDFADGSAIVVYDPATKKNYVAVGFFEGTLTGRIEVYLDSIGSDGTFTGRVHEASSRVPTARWEELRP
jgi:hypothetical protein